MRYAARWRRERLFVISGIAHCSETAGNRAAFLTAVGQGMKAAAIVGANIASLFPGIGVAGAIALAILNNTPLDQAILAIAGGAIGGKLLGELLQITAKIGGKAFAAAKRYASSSGFARRNLQESSSGILSAGAGGGRMAEIRRLGLQGEDAVRSLYDIGPKIRISINGRVRIPDGIKEGSRVLSEVKNVKSLSYTQQLRDYSDYARLNGMRFDLYVRESSSLTGPLRNAISDGKINLIMIPK